MKSPFFDSYPLVICYIATETMAHKNSWFTELKDGDFPQPMLVFVCLSEGKIGKIPLNPIKPP